MSCACEHRKMASDLERIRKLAKGCARLEDKVFIIFKRDDGTYGFQSESEEIDKPIIEYITPF